MFVNWFFNNLTPLESWEMLDSFVDQDGTKTRALKEYLEESLSSSQDDEDYLQGKQNILPSF
jgi:hypothetical protein